MAGPSCPGAASGSDVVLITTPATAIFKLSDAEAEAAIIIRSRSTIATVRYVRFIIDPPVSGAAAATFAPAAGALGSGGP